MIDEETYATGKIRVVVIWDEWERLPHEERTATILQAYERVEGREFRDKIALASGLTVPEAHAAGMLPFAVISALRSSDPVTMDQCRQALLDEGASRLFARTNWSCDSQRRRKRQPRASTLPDVYRSEEVWVITQDVGGYDSGQ